MNFFSYVPLLGGFINLILSLFVLLSDRRSRVNQVFFALGLSVTIWNFGSYVLFQDQSPTEAYNWAKFLQYGVIFVPVTMLHVSLLLCGKQPGRWLIFVYAFHVALAGMNVFDMFLGGVRKVFFGYYCVAGIGFKIYMLAFLQSFASIILLSKQRLALPVWQRSRFNGILIAQTLLVVLGTNDLLPIFGLDYYPFTTAHILPWGSLAATAYGLMVAYSVFQHQLMDVRVVLGRSAAYVVRFMFLLLIAVALELGVAAVARPGQMTGFSIVSSVAVIIVSTLMASLFFPKLLGGAAHDLERRLLGDRFEYHDKIRVFIEQCRWHNDLDSLLASLNSLLVNVAGVRSYWMILLDGQKRAFTVFRTHPPQPQLQLPNLASDSAIFKFFLDGKVSYLRLKATTPNGKDRLADDARKDLAEIPGEIVFPMIADSHPLGLLVLGPRTSGVPFAETDTQIISSLTENIALVIHQLSLKDRLLQIQELDLLGRMSQGMAHDLNNHTTPVWTLLQLLAEGTPLEEVRSDLVPTAMRNLKRMREYIKEALFFSEHLRPNFETTRLDTLIREEADLAKQNKRKGKNISYTFESIGEPTVEMDRVLIRRLLTNLISNAIDASPDGSTIELNIFPLVKTDPGRDWFRVRVTDHGSGIKQEHLERIFQPYFTTKRTGDDDRGFGLGLAICRKIASLHGGNLMVTSEPGRGTVMTLDLPSRQQGLHSPFLNQGPARQQPAAASA